MKKLLYYSVFCLLFSVFWVSPAYSQQITTITVEGIGAIVKGDLAIAKDNALNDALRKAVEQAVGTLVQAQTLVDKYQLISDEIYTKSQGYIKKYAIISERPDINQGILRINIQADVSIGDIRNDLNAIGLLIERKGKPRMMVIIDEKIGSAESGYSTNLSESETVIIQKFTEKGFNFVDEATVKKNIKRNMALQAIAGDDSAAASIGLEHGAEVVIIGSAVAKLAGKGIAGTEMKSIHASITVRAVRADTGEIISSASEKGATAHLDETAGGALAIKKAGEKLASSLIDQIIAKWSGEVGGQTTVQLTVSGIDFVSLNKFKTIIQSQVRGVLKLNQRSFTAGVAVIDVETKTNAQSMAEELAMKNFETFKVEIIGLSANKIDVKVIPL
ncbi:MAG TPA: flagellar assembly protein T N-terminal domain-containing protein [Nitrospinota bacterium]|nr:flagellar assembly protein T N-terminal domain-containing protein [Nitrospinota bacterium]